MLCKNCGTVEAPSGADYCSKCEDLWLQAGMTRDEQEALSRRYCNEVIILLPLKSGRVAVFNNESRHLCDIVEDIDAQGLQEYETTWLRVREAWRPPAIHKPTTVDLKELGLLE